MTFSLRLNDNDSNLIKAYAEMHNLTISELFRQSVLDRIEDEHDLKAWNEAYAVYKADPVTYTHEEVCRMLLEDDN